MRFLVSIKDGEEKYQSFKEPKWTRIDMDSDVKLSLWKKKEKKSYIFFHNRRNFFRCFDVQRQDSWSRAKIMFPFDIPIIRVAVVSRLIKNNWNKPVDPFCRKPKDIDSECRFGCRTLVPILIDYFFRGSVDFHVFRYEKKPFNSPYYEWPLQILQARNKIRFGRCSWRLE